MLEKFKTVKRIKFPALSKWELTSRLASGQWSHVYRARPATGGLRTHTRRPSEPTTIMGEVSEGNYGDYVIKLAKRGDQNSIATQMLDRESLISSNIHHSNLITILDNCLEGDQRFLVSPFLDGVNLQRMLDRPTRMSPSYSLWIIRQLAGAIAALHEKTIVHCDVAPQNILVSPDGHATLLDLGLAQFPNRPSGGILNHEALPIFHLAGTLDYLAPEQLDRIPSCGTTVDIYALGGVAFRMITGSLPSRFDDRTPERDRLVQLLDGNIATADLLLSMIDLNPELRPSANEIAKRLWPHEVSLFAQRAA